MAEVKRQIRVLRFANFEVNLDSGELRRDGLKLKFSGQPFQVLAILLERPGDVVTREELQKRLWPDTFVDVERNLNTAVNKIREVLGDSAESPRFIETLPRRGYRFIAPVETDLARQFRTGSKSRPRHKQSRQNDSGCGCRSSAAQQSSRLGLSSGFRSSGQQEPRESSGSHN